MLGFPGTKDKERPQKVLVIGASAGGLNAVKELIAQVDRDFPVPVLVVLHISPDISSDVFLNVLNRSCTLKCMIPKDGDALRAGYLYLAPADHHMMIGSDQKILISKGAPENRSRPSIDPLFRSAALAFGNGVVSLLLSGYLDDGTAGMQVIKRCGGLCIVQDPDDAEFPDMPRNALSNVEVDHVVPLKDMGVLLRGLLDQDLGDPPPIPEDIMIEGRIAERVASDLASVNALGDQVPFNCPGCGGVLWQVKTDPLLRFRCHTGHAYTSTTLLSEQNKKIEETMWVALRMFEERRNLLTTMADQNKGLGMRIAMERAKESQMHIDRIRTMLTTTQLSINDAAV
jgi:two-component system, chemotaxis family, protein-glutamate methylesterase/glutaminase